MAQLLRACKELPGDAVKGPPVIKPRQQVIIPLMLDAQAFHRSLGHILRQQDAHALMPHLVQAHIANRAARILHPDQHGRICLFQHMQALFHLPERGAQRPGP